MTNAQKLRTLSIALTAVGLVDALYLTYVKLSNQRNLCLQGVGDCWSVNTSQYSEVFGIPVALFGAGAYFMILILLLLEAKGPFWNNNSPLIIFGITLAGFLYSAYLTYLEIAVIKAICPFCVLSALVMTILLGLSITRLMNNQQNLILD